MPRTETKAAAGGKRSTSKGAKAATKDEKKERRLLRNRISAQLHRERQRVHLANLDITVDVLTKERDYFERRVQQLERAMVAAGVDMPPPTESRPVAPPRVREPTAAEVASKITGGKLTGAAAAEAADMDAAELRAAAKGAAAKPPTHGAGKGSASQKTAAVAASPAAQSRPGSAQNQAAMVPKTSKTSKRAPSTRRPARAGAGIGSSSTGSGSGSDGEDSMDGSEIFTSAASINSAPQHAAGATATVGVAVSGGSPLHPSDDGAATLSSTTASDTDDSTDALTRSPLTEYSHDDEDDASEGVDSHGHAGAGDLADDNLAELAGIDLDGFSDLLAEGGLFDGLGDGGNALGAAPVAGSVGGVDTSANGFGVALPMSTAPNDFMPALSMPTVAYDGEDTAVPHHKYGRDAGEGMDADLLPPAKRSALGDQAVTGRRPMFFAVLFAVLLFSVGGLSMQGALPSMGGGTGARVPGAGGGSGALSPLVNWVGSGLAGAGRPAISGAGVAAARQEAGGIVLSRAGAAGDSSDSVHGMHSSARVLNALQLAGDEDDADQDRADAITTTTPSSGALVKVPEGTSPLRHADSSFPATNLSLALSPPQHEDVQQDKAFSALSQPLQLYANTAMSEYYSDTKPASRSGRADHNASVVMCPDAMTMMPNLDHMWFRGNGAYNGTGDVKNGRTASGAIVTPPPGEEPGRYSKHAGGGDDSDYMLLLVPATSLLHGADGADDTGRPFVDGWLEVGVNVLHARHVRSVQLG